MYVQQPPNKYRKVGNLEMMGEVSSKHHRGHNQWEFQDPKMEVPTIYKAYVRPM